MTLAPENVLLASIALAAIVTTVAASICLRLCLRRPKNLPNYTPPVSIFKPLKGIDDGLEENLRSFFRLDYPAFQLLFCVADPKDPAIAVVEKLLDEFPDQDAQLIIGCPAFGLNPKVESLAVLARYRRHDVILISDSNVRVRPNYLRETACYLADPSVGLVTNLFAGVDEQHFSAALENLQLNGLIAGNFAAASKLGITCVVGKSMLMPAKVLTAIGGFAGVRNLLAEDQVIGMKVRKAGYTIKLSHHVIENVNKTRGFRWFLNRHSRWFKIRRRLSLPIFLLEPLVNLATLGTTWVLSGDPVVGFLGFLSLVSLGMARDAVHSYWLRGTWPEMKYLLLSPIKDFFLLPIWFDSLVNQRVMWRGHRFTVGHYTRLRREGISPAVRRRVRRVRRLRDVNHFKTALMSMEPFASALEALPKF